MLAKSRDSEPDDSLLLDIALVADHLAEKVSELQALVARLTNPPRTRNPLSEQN